MVAMDTTRRDRFVDRVFTAGLDTMDVFTIYLGERLGLYGALQQHGPLDAAGLARRAGIDERYAREWLEQQAVTGTIEVDADEDGYRFRLPAEHAEVLLDPRSPNYLAPFARMLASIGRQTEAIAEAYQDGSGVRWDAYGHDMVTGQADFNRPAFEGLLASEWIPAIPELQRLLVAGARVADIACGAGWSSLALAQGFPGVEVDGYGYDVEALAIARAEAAAAGLDDRVRFHRADVSDLEPRRPYDVVTVFEALHDLSQPIEALTSIRRILKPRGLVLVMDERVSGEFGSGIGDDVERLMYGWSTLLCLVNAKAEWPSAATGTVMRESTLRRYAAEAGFTAVDVAPIEHDFFRFYVLRP